MAYFSQENKASKAPAIKAILKKYGLKGSLSVNNHSTLVLTIREGKIDFIKNLNERCINEPRFTPVTNYIDVNPYWYKEHFTGVAKDCLTELLDVMNIGNHDRSDPQTDYFDIGWYVDIKIGNWDKPYIFVKE
jgi:hypothetical protein